MATPALALGSYTFPNSMFQASVADDSAVPIAKLPRADGARIPTVYLKERKVQIKGALMKPIGASSPTLISQLDSLKAALNGGPQNLTLATGRYLRNVQKESFTESYEGSWPERIVDVTADMVTGDPFFYETAVQTITQAISGTPTTWNVTAGGNAYALPQWKITAVSTATLTLTLTNNTTGEAFTFSLAVTAGDVVIVDSLLKTVQILTADKTAGFDGIFPRLLVGVNSVTLSYSANTVSQVQAVFNQRFW